MATAKGKIELKNCLNIANEIFVLRLCGGGIGRRIECTIKWAVTQRWHQ